MGKFSKWSTRFLNAKGRSSFIKWCLIQLVGVVLIPLAVLNQKPVFFVFFVICLKYVVVVVEH